MEPIHSEAEMLLMKSSQRTLKSTRLSSQVDSEIGIPKNRSVNCGEERKANTRRAKLNQAKTRANRNSKGVRVFRQSQLVVGQTAPHSYLDVFDRSAICDGAASVEVTPSPIQLPPTRVSVNAALLCRQ